MRILLVHNQYQQHGGEDDVFACERDLLRQHGHEVVEYVRNSHEIENYSPLQKIRLGARATWAQDTYDDLTLLIKRERPVLAHFHNTFPFISPAAYYACQRGGVAVVQMLHNARLLCPGGNYYRDGRVCKDCLGKPTPWPGVLHGCYRHSRMQTAAAAAMLSVHNHRGTFRSQVDAYIAPTEFYRHLFVEAGFPAHTIHVKPHFVPHDPGVSQEQGSYALFIGRLADLKGADALAQAWEELHDIPLKVRGDGPLESMWRQQAAAHPNIELLPHLDYDAYFSLMRGARFLVWPSAGYYETFGRVAIEAFACGIPVIASNIGANAEVVHDGETGLHFESGDAADMARKVRWAWEHADEMRVMGARARAQYERDFRPERNYEMLIDIYQRALARRGIQVSSEPARAMAQLHY